MKVLLVFQMFSLFFCGLVVLFCIVLRGERRKKRERRRGIDRSSKDGKKMRMKAMLVFQLSSFSLWFSFVVLFRSVASIPFPFWGGLLQWMAFVFYFLSCVAVLGILRFLSSFLLLLFRVGLLSFFLGVSLLLLYSVLFNCR